MTTHLRHVICDKDIPDGMTVYILKKMLKIIPLNHLRLEWVLQLFCTYFAGLRFLFPQKPSCKNPQKSQPRTTAALALFLKQ
ncbi:hypothetical protein [Enterobacter sp. 168J2]|uniref:hypothetical protein n=1 Tax=Enterobacter sp. 168J2 TaxID=3077758 RepID=UPI001249D1B7|nr:MULTISPECIES: hypothetical protein [Enterobacter]EJC0567106.1 hypothetical protein [Enterobacter cloacae]MCP1115653.1 hypothetical protein [Enterobacter bugandensis]HBU6131525.1 hypothetical protein [Enterobacter cloacae]